MWWQVTLKLTVSPLNYIETSPTHPWTKQLYSIPTFRLNSSIYPHNHNNSLCVVLRRNQPIWFGHDKRMDDNSWVKKCTHLSVAGKRDRGRLWLTWDSCIQGYGTYWPVQSGCSGRMEAKYLVEVDWLMLLLLMVFCICVVVEMNCLTQAFTDRSKKIFITSWFNGRKNDP